MFPVRLGFEEVTSSAHDQHEDVWSRRGQVQEIYWGGDPMKSHFNRSFLGMLIVSFIFSVPLRAQVAGATITGTVTDVSGGVIANAQVSAKNTATAVVTSTKSNSDGLYTVTNLIPGEYQVTVAASGFTTKALGVTLTVGAQRVLDVTMTVGQSQQTVQVTEEAPTIQLATSTISGVVEGTEVRELPLNGRDWASLATLEPGVATVRTQEAVTQVGSHARGLGMQMTIDGNRPTQNTYRLNGAIINDYSNAGPGSVLGQNLGVDAIQEFSVLTNNYNAEYGFTSGGVINAITRSGTNNFHGSAYEFIRNSALDAGNFFENASGLPKAAFRRNQFGGSAGGPIWKDKVFVFGDYEGLRQSKGIPHIGFVPSPEARKGILGDPNTGAPQAPITVDSNIAKFLVFYPAVNDGLISPANGATCDQVTVICNTGRYAFSGAQVVPENYYTARTDVKFSEKNSLNGSYYHDHSTFTQPDGLNQVLDQFALGRQGFSVEETHLFGAGLANTVRGGYNRSYANGQLTPSAINPAAADTSFGMVAGLYAPRITVAGLTTFRGGLRGQSVQNYMLQTYQFYDDAARTFGKHNLKFGGALILYHLDLFAPFIEDGTATFSDLQHFLQNIVHIAGSPPDVAAIKTHHNRTSVFAGYVQDDWKFRPSLTLNLGLRYEMETIPSETSGLIANMPTITSDPSACVSASNCPGMNKFYFPHNPTNKNFEPRLGFAWDPFHSGKTSVRGGFGIFDALPLPYELVINNAQTSPFHNVITVVNPPQGSFPKIPFPSSFIASAQTWNYVDTAIKRNYIYQYNLSVQRQLTGSLALTVAYAGSRGIHNPFQIDDINTVFPTLTSGRWLFPNPVGSGVINPNATSIVPGQLINANVAAIQTTLWQSMSYYNALQVQLEKRMSHGLQVLSSFTWGRTMDTSSGSFAGDNFSADLSPTIPWWDLKIVRGLSDFNVSSNLTINALWDVPAPKSSFLGPAGWAVRGWQLGGIVQASSGVPLWPLDGVEGDPMGQLNSEPIAIPDRVAGCQLTFPSSGRHGSLQYVNPACLINAQAPSQSFYNANCDPKFAAPTCINLLGNLGRNTIIGPGLVNVDFSMVKNNKIPRISENFAIQFRAEFFNVFNHTNFAPPVDNLEALDASGNPVPGFGQIDATQIPNREIQFALKFTW
jgi:Carboxypeptidase regulatory-like domain/TonB dependent receptor